MTHVNFDFERSLQVARDVWAFADDLYDEIDARDTQAGHASEDWVGPHQETFAQYVRRDRSSTIDAWRELRNGARGWAASWKAAMDQENQMRRTAEWERREREDSPAWWQVWASGPERPPDPTPAAVPQPPDFEPTRTFYTPENP